MRINVHAGHNPDGKVGCGAIGLIKESTENRNVKNEVIRQLQALGHTVYDCTVDDGTSAGNVLTKIVKKCNAHTVDLDVSIHFNAGAKNTAGNGKTTGTEVYVYTDNSKAKSYAQAVCNAISALGYKNRGVKVRTDLYFLRNTKAPAMLIECCFVDDKDDIKLYNVQSMASAIVKGITGQSVAIQPVQTQQQTQTAQASGSFMVKVKVDELNYRAGAGTEHKVNGVIKDKGTYTIVETAKAKDGGTWGKLKSGAGWINISNKYVTRV